MINVLSLFDGMSCGHIALQRANISVGRYFASEIKSHAMEVTKKHYPSTIFVGDVRQISYANGVLITPIGSFTVDIHLLIGGSPCQNFSCLNSYQDIKDYGLKGQQSSLFFEYLRLLREIKPTYFLLENVRMKKESEVELNTYLGVEGAHINSNLVSAQNRHRIYWTNIEFYMPENKNIRLADILEDDVEHLEAAKVTKSPSRDKMYYGGKCKNITHENKASCLTTKQDRWNNAGLLDYKDYCRFLTPIECERLQTVPDNYTAGISTAKRYDLLGDGWTVDVVAHIFKALALSICNV
jgi:site-specific DNA-cytosine methylase